MVGVVDWYPVAVRRAGYLSVARCQRRFLVRLVQQRETGLMDQGSERRGESLVFQGVHRLDDRYRAVVLVVGCWLVVAVVGGFRGGSHH